jgi:hypothetical protein
VREIGSLGDAKAVKIVMSHGDPLSLSGMLGEFAMQGRRGAAISLANRVLRVSFDVTAFVWRAVIRGGIPVDEFPPERWWRWLEDNHAQSLELGLAYAMARDTPRAKSLEIARRAARAGDWVGMLLLALLDDGAAWEQRAIAAGAPDVWRGIEEGPSTGPTLPRQRVERALARCGTAEEGLRLAKRVARRRCLASDRVAGPIARLFVMHKFGMGRPAAAAERAALLLATELYPVSSSCVQFCRRAEANAFLLMVAHGWRGIFHLRPSA